MLAVCGIFYLLVYTYLHGVDQSVLMLSTAITQPTLHQPTEKVFSLIFFHDHRFNAFFWTPSLRGLSNSYTVSLLGREKGYAVKYTPIYTLYNGPFIPSQVLIRTVYYLKGRRQIPKNLGTFLLELAHFF